MRPGQSVRAPVTQRKRDGTLGKTYKTMFTIKQTNAADSIYAQNEAQRLSDKGIGLKSITDTNVLALPGGQPYAEIAQDLGLSGLQAEQRAKTLWSLDSNIQYGKAHGENVVGRETMFDRLLNVSPNKDSAQARDRLIEGV